MWDRAAWQERTVKSLGGAIGGKRASYASIVLAVFRNSTGTNVDVVQVYHVVVALLVIILVDGYTMAAVSIKPDALCNRV